MTISTTTIINSYSGDASTTVFNYTFKITDQDDIEVITRTSAGTESVKTITTDYTVSGVGNANGGSVTFTTAPASGLTVILRRDTPQTQGLDLIENDPLPANSLEDAFDKLTSITQELQEQNDRSIKLSRTNTMTSTEFTVGATDRANKILAFDDDGEISVTQELGTFQGTDTTTTTEAYNVRDLIKSSSTAELNNVYICIADSVVGDLLTDTDHFALIVDAKSASDSQTAAAASATAAATSATTATTKASEASASAASALSHKNDSETAKTASETAQTAAEAAQTAAETAQSAAETALDTFDDKFLGSKSTDPTVDNDGNALTDGALYFDTTNNVMKVYDLGNTEWKQLTPTSAQQTNIDTVSGDSADIQTLAGISSDISTTAGVSSDIETLADIEDGTDATDAIQDVAGVASDVTTVAGQISPTNNISTIAGISNSISTVAGISSDVTQAATDSADIQTIASDLSGSNNIGTIATNITNVNNVGSSIANVNNVSNNLASVNNFGEVYRISANAPTDSLDVGDLWYDTTNNLLKVYGSGGFVNAGSAVNGTADRFKFTATAGQTTFSGSDDNSTTLAYDAGFIDVYLNGIKLVSGASNDYVATSGTSIVLNSGAALNDILEVIAYGTFELSNFSITDANDVPALGTANQILAVNSGATALEFVDSPFDASNISSGTLPNARLSSIPNSALANSSITLNGSSVSLGGSATIGTTWESKSSAFTAEAGKAYYVDTSGGAFTATLPASPSQDDEVRFLDVTGSFDTNNLTVGRNSEKIQGDASDLTVSTERAGFALVYYNSTQGWLIKDK